MIANISTVALAVFIASLVYILAGWQLLLSRSGVSGGGLLRFWLPVVGWMSLTGGLAYAGILYAPTAMPPRMLIVLAPMLLCLLWLSFTPKVRGFVRQAPAALLIGLQSFRVLVEIALHLFASEGQLPVEMSWEGRNFDVVVGITAIPVAIYVQRCVAQGKALPKRLIQAWNIMGLVLVSIVAGHGILSAPTPIQQLHLSVDNIIIFTLPVVWLPAVEVLSAYALHILSLRQMRQLS